MLSVTDLSVYMQEQVVAWSRIIMGLAAKEDQAKDALVHHFSIHGV